MEGKPNMAEPGNSGEAAVSVPQPIPVPPKPEQNPGGCSLQAAADAGPEDLEYQDRDLGVRSSSPKGPEDATGAFQGQASFQDRSGMGESGSGNDGSTLNCEDRRGSEGPQYMQGDWYSDAGPRQMPPGTGQRPHFGAYGYQPGYYGNSPFGMGGPGQWPHSGAAHHAGCFGHFPGMHGQYPHGPHFGPEPGTGFGYAEPPHHSGHGDRNFNHLSEMVGKALQGQANPQDLISGLLNLNFSGEQFWKGVVVGSVAALLLNSDSVRQALMGTLSGFFGKPEQKAQTDDNAEQ